MQNVSRFDKVNKFEYAVSVSGWDVFSQLGFCAAFEHTGTWRRLSVRHSIKSSIRPVALHKQPEHMQSPHSPNENRTNYPKTSPFPLQDSTFVFYFKTAACWNQMLSVPPYYSITKSCVFLVFDQLDLVTYEEVVKLPAFKRKTLVLLGVYVV